MSNKLKEQNSAENKGRGLLISLSLAHFLMDYMCHFYMFRFVKGAFTSDRVVALFILYNFLAFALQCPIGYLCDKVGVRLSVAVSLAMLGVGYLFAYLAFTKYTTGAAGALLVIIGVLIIGLANSALHAGGVNGVMKPGKKGLIRGGVFISFGALGVGLGDFYGSKAFDWITIVLFIVSMIAMVALFTAQFVSALSKRRAEKKDVDNVPGGLSIKGDSSKAVVVLVLCLVAVLARSYGGFLLPSGFTGLNDAFNGSIMYDIRKAMLPSDLGFIGKLLGGFLVLLSVRLFKAKTDLRVASLRYGVAALIISGILLVFFGEYTVPCALGIILFHSVMPVTLYEVYCLLPKNPGFSLGLTTLMLFIGTLPTYVYNPSGSEKQLVLGITIAIAAAGLGICAGINSKEVKES